MAPETRMRRADGGEHSRVAWPQYPADCRQGDDAVEDQRLACEGRLPAAIQHAPREVDVLPIPALRVEPQLAHRRPAERRVGRRKAPVQSLYLDVVLEEWDPALYALDAALHNPDVRIGE